MEDLTEKEFQDIYLSNNMLAAVVAKLESEGINKEVIIDALLTGAVMLLKEKKATDPQIKEVMSLKLEDYTCNFSTRHNAYMLIKEVEKDIEANDDLS
jgi:hypothetical protein